MRATVNDLRGGKLQGGSTITQQYVKNTYVGRERTVWRKLKEAVLAVKLERELTKDELLERYLNTVYFGRGAYGVQAAAQAWFGKDVVAARAARGELSRRSDSRARDRPMSRRIRRPPNGAVIARCGRWSKTEDDHRRRPPRRRGATDRRPTSWRKTNQAPAGRRRRGGHRVRR